jgi:hypothetical protein
MAGTHRIPPTIDCVGTEDMLRSLHRVVLSGDLKLAFESINVHSVDRSVPKHDMSR